MVAAGATISIGGAIALVKSISGPELSAALIDVTCLASTAREYLASPIPNSGKVSCSMFYDPAAAGVIAARAAVAAGTEVACVITLSDDTDFTFDAYVENFKINVGGVDEAVTCDIDLQISGAIT